MDVEDDIQKIEHFLETLKKSSSTETECSSTKTVKNLTKRHEANDSLCPRVSNERFTYLQICMDKNEECQRLLSSLESSLTFLLEECWKEQKIVRENIEACENRKVGERTGCFSRSFSLRKICSSPYFKDRMGFPSQYNEDLINRRNLGYLNPWDVVITSAWTDDQKRKLEKGIKDMEIQESRKSTKHPYKINTDLADIDDDKCTEKIHFEEVICSEEKEYDWIKISVIDLRSARSPLECQAMWYNYLHPTINKKRWTETESETLKELVKQHKYQDWDRIVDDLGTGRSAYQCIGHFKIRLADFSKVKWTQNETLYLTKYVNLFRIRYFIPWCKIAWFMDGRGSSEIYRKWINDYADMKKGKFSLEEDILLAAGLKEFGNNWSQISEYFPNRHSTQLRGRLLVLKGREQNLKPWTPYEDDLLESLVKKYGFGNWAKVSSHFISRNNVQIRTRYRSLARWKQKTGSESLTMHVESRAPKTVKSEHCIDGLWEKAKNIVIAKQSKKDSSNGNEMSDVKLMNELSKILKPRKKPGRKKGTINYPSFHNQFYNYFHVAHGQRGGRGRDICTKEKIPVLAYQIVLALQLLDARICLPSESESVYKDHNMLEMDKSVIVFIINRKDFIQDKCTFIQFKDSVTRNDMSSNSHIIQESSISHNETSCEWYSVCSPCLTTLIGLRTMLLNRTNVKVQSRGFTVQNPKYNSGSLNCRQFSIHTKKYREACKLWNRRIGILYTWAAFLSKIYPHDQFVVGPANKNDSMSPEEQANKKRRSKKKRRVKYTVEEKDELLETDNKDATKQEKQKRAYVKSGKFSVKNTVTGYTRRNTRQSKTVS